MRVAVATCAPSAFAVADLYSRAGEPKDPLLEDEGDEQVDAVCNKPRSPHPLTAPLSRPTDTTQRRVGPIEPTFTASSKLVSDLALISVTRATVPDTMTSQSRCWIGGSQTVTI
jgi:hypothetical protein